MYLGTGYPFKAVRRDGTPGVKQQPFPSSSSADVGPVEESCALLLSGEVRKF